MLEHTHDETADAWYFRASGSSGDHLSDHTKTLTSRTVIIDYDARGNVIGVEVL